MISKIRQYLAAPKVRLLGAPVTALCIIAISATITACDNRADEVGASVFPEYSKVTAETFSVPLSYNTISAGSLGGQLTSVVTEDGMTLNNIYVNSSYAYLGSIPNEEYGEVKSEYLTQLHVPAGFKFAEDPFQNKIDSVFVLLYYSEYAGDGSQPMEAEAYQITRPLPAEDAYSIGDITPYITGARKLGEVSYTAAKGNGTVGTNHLIKIPVDTAFGQMIYDMSRSDDPAFASQEAFDKFFAGIYLKNGAGKGSVLRVARTSLAMYYQAPNPNYDPNKPVEGVTEYRTMVQELSHTGEVPQTSRYGNYDLSRLIGTPEEHDGYAFVKSPAGVFAEITIPTTQIATLMAAEEGYEKTLNSAPLTIVAEPGAENIYRLNAPSDLLLLPKDSVQGFFEREYTELNARFSSFVSSTAIAGSATYTFGNIAPLLVAHIEAKPAEDLKVLVIPIERTLSGISSSGSSTGDLSSSISNQILPAAVKIETGNELNRSLSIYITKKKKGSAF